MKKIANDDDDDETAAAMAAAEEQLTTEPVEPFFFSRMLVDTPEVVAAGAVAFCLFWMALIPVFGVPILDSGSDSFRASSGEAPETLFMFKAGLLASVATGIDPNCADIGFDQIPTLSAADLAALSAAGAGDCGGMEALLTASGMTCDSNLHAALSAVSSTMGDADVAFVLPSDATRLAQLCPHTCGQCGDGGSVAGEAGEAALQSKPMNMLQLVFESWADDPPDEYASGGNVLTVENIQRICDAAAALEAVPNYDSFCFKPGGGSTCAKPQSLCSYMSPTTTLTFAIEVSTNTGAADSLSVQQAAIAQLLDPASGFGLTRPAMNKLLQFVPAVSLPPQLAASLEQMGATVTDGVLSGSSKYGVCTSFGARAVGSAEVYDSITLNGCSIPDGNGPIVTSDAQALEIATALRNSADTANKNFLLTADFITGVSDQVPATKMRAMSAVPYNRQTFDALYDLTAKSETECKADFDDRDINYDNCNPIKSFLNDNGAPRGFVSFYDSKYSDDEEGNRDLATEWWHLLSCGRIVLSYNAQCVEELNQLEQQALYKTHATQDLFPLVNDDMVLGNGDFEFSGTDGSLRIYFTEFSELTSLRIDGIVQGDGLKAGFAMFFTWAYMGFHMNDLGMSTVGLIHLVLTIPVALAVYSGPFGFGRFNTLCPLGVFVLLGIGADNIFIVYDMWRQSRRYFEEEDLHARMAWTWSRSSHSMLTTTLTTVAAFMANGASPIGPIAVFGIFTALLVFIQFLLVVTWFPAMIIMKEQGKLAFYVPAYCGCFGPCLGLSYIKYKKNRSQVQDETAESSATMSSTERAFFEVFAPGIDSYKIPIVTVGTFVSLLYLAFAVQLEGAEDATRMLPDHDPMQRLMDLGAHDEIGVFTKGTSTAPEFVNVFFGQDSIDRSLCDFLDGSDYGILQTSSQFEATIATAAAQAKFMSICNRFRDPNDPSGAGAYLRRIDDTAGELFCVFEAFQTWIVQDKGLIYPDAFTTDCVGECVPIEKFRLLISEFSDFQRMRGQPAGVRNSAKVSVGNRYQDMLRFDLQQQVPCGDRRIASERALLCRPLKMVSLYFNSTFSHRAPRVEMNEVDEAVGKLIDEANMGTCTVSDQYTDSDCAAAGGTWTGELAGFLARHTTEKYVTAETERVLFDSAIWGTVFSLGLAGVMILGVTKNYLVTSWSLLVIFLVVNAVVGTMVMLGWSLGVVESICITICVGLSVDYTIHLCHIFASSTAPTRFEAGRDALASMGVSVFNAAVTTMLSAIVMMNSYILFFEKFGVFIFLNIFYSTSFAFILLMAILMLVGPIQGAGKLSTLLCDGGDSNAMVPNPMNKEDDEEGDTDAV